MNRRELLKTGAAFTLGMSAFPLGWRARAETPKRRILMYTHSEGYEHSVVQRKNGRLSLAEHLATSLGAKNGFEVTCTKDGRVFENEDLGKYDGFLFETQGNLEKEGIDKQPPMTPKGKEAFLTAVAQGKGYVGCHCASDTFHSKGDRAATQSADQLDPYIVMLGGEFIVHGKQQKAWMRVVDHDFPGTKDLNDFDLQEEWYALKNFAPDLHVIIVQDTHGMEGPMYQRPSYPATWAHRHEKGRVFFTSMGHREDVWSNPKFQNLLLGGLSWSVGNVDADITPNLAKVAPHAGEIPGRK